MIWQARFPAHRLNQAQPVAEQRLIRLDVPAVSLRGGELDQELSDLMLCGCVEYWRPSRLSSALLLTAQLGNKEHYSK